MKQFPIDPTAPDVREQLAGALVLARHERTAYDKKGMVSERLARCAEVLADAAHQAAIAARAVRHDEKTYWPAGRPDDAEFHEFEKRPQAYATMLHAVHECRGLARRVESLFKGRAMKLLLEEVRLMDYLDWDASLRPSRDDGQAPVDGDGDELDPEEDGDEI